jgi:hypothetical protein
MSIVSVPLSAGSCTTTLTVSPVFFTPTKSSQTYVCNQPFSTGGTIAFTSTLSLSANSGEDTADNDADLRLFIQYFQADGTTPLTGETVTTASGTNYAQSPEPAGFAMVGFGLGFVVLCRARARPTVGGQRL